MVASAWLTSLLGVMKTAATALFCILTAWFFVGGAGCKCAGQ